MSHTYDGNDTNFPASLTLPDDGDPRDAASVNTPIEGLADRTATLGRYVRVTDAGASDRPVVGMPLFSSEFDYNPSDGSLTQNGGGGTISWPLEVPDGCTLDAVEVFWAPAAGHAAGGGGILHPSVERPHLIVWRKDPADFGGVAIGSDLQDPNFASPAVYETPHGFRNPASGSLAEVVNRELNHYVAYFFGEAGTGFIAGGVVWGLRVTFTPTTIDPRAA
jgi:hypothetical protein